MGYAVPQDTNAVAVAFFFKVIKGGGQERRGGGGGEIGSGEKGKGGREVYPKLIWMF